MESSGTHFLEYSDGTFAEYFRKRIIFSDDGIKKWRIWLRPGKDIIELYGLKVGEDLDRSTGITVKDYDYNDVHVCRDDPNFSRIWIEPDFNGDPTPYSMRNAHLKEQIKNFQRQIVALKVMVAGNQEEMTKMVSSKKEWMKEVMDVVLEAMRVKKRTTEDEDEGYEGAEQ